MDDILANIGRLFTFEWGNKDGRTNVGMGGRLRSANILLIGGTKVGRAHRVRFGQLRLG